MPATEDCRQPHQIGEKVESDAVARITANTVNFSMNFLHSRIPHTVLLPATCYVSRVGRAIAAS